MGHIGVGFDGRGNRSLVAGDARAIVQKNNVPLDKVVHRSGQPSRPSLISTRPRTASSPSSAITSC